MPATDPRIDAYIKKAAPFAQPILKHLRELVHTGCPGCQETIKWGMPFFDYKGPFCSIASFKQHCTFGFWKTALIDDPKGIMLENKDKAMGSLGRITDRKDLPSDKAILALIRSAKKLNDADIKLPARKTTQKKEIPVPDYFSKELKKHKKAAASFDAFSPSHRREYLEWITEAKTEETRNKRMATAIEWIAEGKNRNWKYQSR